MERYLLILEVSQKQAYIFSSNKLKDNIRNSTIIAYVTSPEYLEKTLGEKYSNGENLVYSGGGHAILEFNDGEKAISCSKIITEKIYRDYDLQVFAKKIKYKNNKSPKDNLKDLTYELEKKKSRKRAYFHHGTFGVEKIDATTLDAIRIKENKENKENDIDFKKYEKRIESQLFPDGISPVKAFDELGGSKNESNFIAVVHIDGNGMGKRKDELFEIIDSEDWETTKNKLREFSEDIDEAFKTAFRKMTERIALNQQSGKLNDLNLKKDNFPIRNIITAGDDICFVSEGRIGLEASAVFIEELSKIKNKVDNEPYYACAGVALVHQKFPFFRAYELAEQLCKNAKSFGAAINKEDNGRTVSSIDWHIEFGEMKNSLEEIRNYYVSEDGNSLILRPYIINEPKSIMDNKLYFAQRYFDFKNLLMRVKNLSENYPSGKLKELRNRLKNGENATINYLVFNRMKDLLLEAIPEIDKEDIKKLFSGKTKNYSVFVLNEVDNKKHTNLFDVIELMDTFIPLD